ncbi:MAG TPA: class I SAM-dependent methyltransferase [Blastocatellia bacterium]|nr:class I SAM-dependent methyltransferase [Blastocatellia bacterium]
MSHCYFSDDVVSESLKSQVHDFWEANPCGAKFAEIEIGTPEFFAQVEKHRYATEWHIPEVIRFERWSGRDVLEVGCGLGTEAVRFARVGAHYTGVDLTERSIELARRRFDQEGLAGQLRVADAEALPFDDESFDLVYSHGVLHHTPDTQRAIDEIHRVLRPEGTAMVMLYHKRSYNYYVNIMTLRRWGIRLLAFDWGPSLVSKVTGEDRGRLVEMQRLYRSDARSLLSRENFVSQNTDGVGNPLAKVYTRRTATKMFSRFASVSTEVHFINKRWIPIFGKLMPRGADRLLARIAGWHLWIIARKGERQ